MLEKGIIEHSDSPYSRAITPVKKRDGTICLWCDFRKLNAKTIPKSFPIPKAENILDDMNEADVFIVLDLNSPGIFLLMKVISIRLHLLYPV